MKLRILLLACWLAGAPWMRGQVHVEVIMDQGQYLPSESLMVGVRITNQSGQTIRLGDDNNWLRLIVETSAGKPLPQRDPIPVQGPFTLESSQRGTRLVDLAPYFPLTLPGHFRVAAIVRIKQWGQSLTSDPRSFEIVKGFKLWEQEFGVPQTDPANHAPPEARKYMLLKANYLQRMLLYACVSDLTESRIVRVFALMPMVSFSQPEAQLDRTCNLHVICQTGARSFKYCVIDPMGQLISRQTYAYSTSRPVLRPDGDGGFRIVGGVRQLKDDDLPSSRPIEPTIVVPTNAPPPKS